MHYVQTQSLCLNLHEQAFWLPQILKKCRRQTSQFILQRLCMSMHKMSKLENSTEDNAALLQAL